MTTTQEPSHGLHASSKAAGRHDGGGMNRVSRPTWRFALLPALAVVLLTCVLLFVGQRLLGAELIERSLARNQQRADVMGLQLQLALRDAVSQVRLLARSQALQPGVAPARARAELDHLVERSPRFVWAGLVAPDGQVIAGSRGWLEGTSLAQRPVFRRGRDGMVGDVHEPVALAPLLARLPGGVRELIDIGEPVLNEAGEVVGVVTVHLGLDWVNEQLALALGEPAAATAEGLQGLVLTEPGTRSVAPGAVVPAGLPQAHPRPQAWRSAEGARWLLAQSALRGLGSSDAPLLPWRAVVLQREDVALAPLRELTSSMLRVGLLSALLLAAAGFWAGRRLLAPWAPIFDSVLASQAGGGADMGHVGARVQDLVAERAQRGPQSPTEMLMGWLARDAGNLRRAIDHVPVAIALTDHHHRCEYVNPAYTRLLGWTTEALRGRIAGEALLDPTLREGLARAYQQLGDPPGEFVMRLEALTSTGETVAVQCHLVPMFDGQGRLGGALQIVHDIRPERSARARADAMAGRLRALADAAVDTLLATLDSAGRVLEWNRGAERLSGHASVAALGQTLDTLLPGFGGCAAWMRAAQIDGACELRVHGQGPDGRERRFEGTLYALGLAPGSARFGLILRDVSERAAQVRLVEATRDEIIQFNRSLLDQEKRTGRRLAQSLHDELGQTLAALRLHWEAWRSASAEQRERMDERIANLIALANRQVRGVLAELRPPLLDELGLVAAIDNEIRQHGDTRIVLQASESNQLQRWPADIEYAVFMVAREALLNALRHADAQVITVQLDGDEFLLELSIGDDGRGLQLPAGAPQLGLIGLRERALAIGAELHIDGRVGHGTMVALTWEATDDETPADEPHLPDR
ncbi:sensor histidine kinase [Roseateles sp. NT4]|uniref:sensor histidine kinase n=1 Tax=Roseateles sp. NT4 TaxID=3453715 RepID=UPI003EEF4B07